MNGVDVSGSQDAAYAQLSAAAEPIIVEVRRKKIGENSEKIGDPTESSILANSPFTTGGGSAVDFIPDLEYEARKTISEGNYKIILKCNLSL